MGEEVILGGGQTQQVECKPYIAIRCRGGTATFLWASSPRDRLESSVDLKVKVDTEELMWLARTLNCRLDEDDIVFPSLDPYNRVLIYACVRKTIRSPRKARYLASLVLDLNSWEAFYWASTIREDWWLNRSVKRLYKVAKAFKILFNLE
ncbi:hypothetical protein DRO55_04275 [Candidatus Bathyarchaeota archaeon]|nr:MAG: hypothetical protein DRO55_04275 [Candidatus Bathyarchaeota archaeon]